MVYSASVAVQALTVISMGGLADDSKSSSFALLRPTWKSLAFFPSPPRTQRLTVEISLPGPRAGHARHRLLVSFAITGSTLCMLFLALSSQSPLWPISSLLALFANVTYGASNVCLNAYCRCFCRCVEGSSCARDLTTRNSTRTRPERPLRPARTRRACPCADRIHLDYSPPPVVVHLLLAIGHTSVSLSNARARDRSVPACASSRDGRDEFARDRLRLRSRDRSPRRTLALHVLALYGFWSGRRARRDLATQGRCRSQRLVVARRDGVCGSVAPPATRAQHVSVEREPVPFVWRGDRAGVERPRSDARRMATVAAGFRLPRIVVLSERL